MQQDADKTKRKFNLGCDVDKEEIFNYPYLSDADTVAYIKKHGQIMFIIRGPNSTMKATLSEMLLSTYPSAQLCCADHYFSKTFNSPNRTKETLKLSHIYCEKKVRTACMKKGNPVIVQNTHMRKFEFQKYLDFASEYNYTVIMAITLYKFNVTPEALEAINPDGLNLLYFKNRLKQWQDVPPLFMGWFLSPNDTSFILDSLQKILPGLLNDGKFCSAFDFYDEDGMWNYFDGRKLLYCIAGYSCDKFKMKHYYLSDLVQEKYGKCYDVVVLGYLVTLSAIFGIVKLSSGMLDLVFEQEDETLADEDLKLNLGSLDINNSFKDTVPFQQLTAEFVAPLKVDDLQDEKIDFNDCKLIHVAQKRFQSYTLDCEEKSVLKEIRSLPEDLQFAELEGLRVCRLPNDKWILQPAKKIRINTIFTGLYV